MKHIESGSTYVVYLDLVGGSDFTEPYKFKVNTGERAAIQHLSLIHI